MATVTRIDPRALRNNDKKLRTCAYCRVSSNSADQLNSYAGYVAPWMNYMIPEDEKDRNPAVVLGPNPSGAITAE